MFKLKPQIFIILTFCIVWVLKLYLYKTCRFAVSFPVITFLFEPAAAVLTLNASARAAKHSEGVNASLH